MIDEIIGYICIAIACFVGMLLADVCESYWKNEGEKKAANAYDKMIHDTLEKWKAQVKE
jgi:hypothetical protein